MGNTYDSYINTETNDDSTNTKTNDDNIVRLNEYDKIAKMGLSCMYMVCSLICGESVDPTKRINVLKSFVGRDDVIQIVSDVPEETLDSTCNETFMEAKDVVKLLFRAYDNVITDEVYWRIKEMYEKSKAFVCASSMRNASVYYAVASNYAGQRKY